MVKTCVMASSVLITNHDVVVPPKPHQPQSFHFPKRSFGKSKIVERSFQPGWFNKWPFLHYDESIDCVFCHVCLMSFKLKRIKSSTRADPAFVTCGFHNWKDATIAFRNHEQSACHTEAVETMVTIPSTVPDVGEMLSQQHASEKLKSRHALHEIINCVRFLSRQGLPLRGDKNECDSNIISLLKMKAEQDKILAELLK